MNEPRTTETLVRRTLRAHDGGPVDVDTVLDRFERTLDGDVIVPLRTEAPRRRPRSALIAAAAAAAIVLVAGLAIASVADDDEGGTRTATSPEAGTGFFVPTELPPGWTLSRIETEPVDLEADRTCPCTIRRWTDPSSDLVLDSFEAADLGDYPPMPASSSETLRPGEEIEVWSDGPDPHQVVRIFDADWAMSVSGEPVGTALQYPIAVHDGTFDPEARELEADEPVTITEPTTFQRVTVVFDTPTGQADYTLVRPGLGDARGTFQGAPAGPVPGGPLYERPASGTHAAMLSGVWNGADIVLGENPDGTEASLTDLRTLAASLRPASAATWEAFVRTAPTTEVEELVDRAVAPTIADLTEG